ncbi:MAG: hypothetical protein AB1425_10055 [Actinomycetota bacterium]
MISAGPAPDAERTRTPVWYVICRLRSNRLELFTLSPRGVTLPVFDREGEARAFLEDNRLRGWQVRETRTGELVSLLFYLSNVESVLCGPATTTEIEGKRGFIARLLESPLLVAR